MLIGMILGMVYFKGLRIISLSLNDSKNTHRNVRRCSESIERQGNLS